MSSLSIVLAGDICPTRRLGPFAPEVEAVFALIRAADLAVGDFEMPLTTAGTPVQKLLNLRANPEIAQDIPALGFGILTLANNHAVDYGWTALDGTARLLQERGLQTIGVGTDRAAAALPAIRTVRGARIGVVAFSCLTPTGMGASDERPGISAIHIETAYEIDPWYQMEEPGDPSVVTVRTRVRDADRIWVEQTVRKAKADCDVLIVSVHWGFGSGDELAEYQEPLGRAFIEAGADVVHGHHPHAIHPVGFHHGKPILYGLSTLVGQQVFMPASDQVQALWAAMSADGIVAELRLDGGVPDVVLHPTMLNADRLPVLAQGIDFDRIEERIRHLSAPLGAAIVRNDHALTVTPRS
ncbi:CapA family protein [Lichenihabitans psoromatis]|uniref:CapA family protein n=1 Tax=Lichenihabitans psoromatis TaxID=2528642 RepID=UPI0010363A4F|nr:CapA family protein [Lichenihabitans psoromatis]